MSNNEQPVLKEFSAENLQLGIEVFELSLSYLDNKANLYQFVQNGEKVLEENYLDKIDVLLKFKKTLDCFETLTYCSEMVKKIFESGIIKECKKNYGNEKVKKAINNLIAIFLTDNMEKEIEKCQNPTDLILIFGKMKKSTNINLFPFLRDFFWHKARSKISKLIIGCNFENFMILSSWTFGTYPKMKDSFEYLQELYPISPFETVKINRGELKVWQNGFAINLREYFDNTNLDEGTKDSRIHQFMALKMSFYKTLASTKI